MTTELFIVPPSDLVVTRCNAGLGWKSRLRQLNQPKDQMTLWALLVTILRENQMVDLGFNCFKNWSSSASSSFIFGLFKQQHNIYIKINVKNDSHRMRCWDLNSRLLDRQSSPITTRPGLPHLTPIKFYVQILLLDYLTCLRDQNEITKKAKQLFR